MRLARHSPPVAAASLGAQAPAQTVVQQTLTLQDAIAMAQRQGPSAQAARSTRDAARYRDHAFNARLLPQMFLNGNAANLNTASIPITLPDGSTQFIAQAQNQSSLGYPVAQKIPLTGGTILRRLGGQPHRSVRRPEQQRSTGKRRRSSSACSRISSSRARSSGTRGFSR